MGVSYYSRTKYVFQRSEIASIFQRLIELLIELIDNKLMTMLDYIDATLIILYRIVPKISNTKIRYLTKICCQKSKKSAFFKWTYRLIGNDYNAVKLFKSYLIDIGVII